MGSPSEEDLLNWAHHVSPTTVPDVLFQAAAGDEVSKHSRVFSDSGWFTKFFDYLIWSFVSGKIERYHRFNCL